MEKQFTFDDLKFKPRNHPFGGIQAIMEFDNGHRISVVGGKGTYGDGIDSFEIWRSIDDGTKGYLSKDEVSEQMIELQKVSKDVPRDPFGF
jgi:hypothetical protein